MSAVQLFPVAGIITLLCAAVLWANVWKISIPLQQNSEKAIAVLLPIAIAISAWGFVSLGAITPNGLKLTLTASAVIVTLLVQIIYLLGVLQHGVRGLGLLLLPVTALPLLLTPFLPDTEAHQIHTSSVLETGHLAISMLGYAVLTLAALHALMQLQLDHALKRKSISPMMQALPSLLEIEQHMFAQVRWSAWLLAIGILTGLAWQWESASQFALLNHKVLLAIFSWAVLIWLLIQHKRAAWHGRWAAHMVLAAYVLLLLAYFGVKLIRTWLS
jgi:ABC-type uncharacterized transport system permease subunit